MRRFEQRTADNLKPGRSVAEMTDDKAKCFEPEVGMVPDSLVNKVLLLIWPLVSKSGLIMLTAMLSGPDYCCPRQKKFLTTPTRCPSASSAKAYLY